MLKIDIDHKMVLGDCTGRLTGALLAAGMILLFLAGQACGQTSVPISMSTSASSPATTSAPASTQPAGTDPAVEKLLDDLEQAGEKYQTLRAGLIYKVEFPSTGEVETRTGTVEYQRKTDAAPAKFRLFFDTLQTVDDARPVPENYEYTFDGEFFTEAKYKIKSMTKYQVAPKGQSVEPMRIGKGPFPLPFGQKKDDVLKLFTAMTRQPIKTDPPGTQYLQLIPRPEQASELNFTRLEMWVDRETLLPAKIISVEKNKNISTVIFKDPQAGQPIKQEIFSPQNPGGSWNYDVRPYEKK
jgi:hypothetical protein